MATKLKTELFIEDDLGNENIIYPFVESNHVSFDNGMTIQNMIAQDVSTPIVVHDTTSFKVGVGDSDISNSVVDSSVGSMTIKGQSYQNIIPDPSLRNKTSGNAMQKFNIGYDNVNVVDGVVKSAILSGKTLVNLFKNSEINYEFNHTNSTTSNVYGFLGRNDLIMTLDKSKVYYIIERWQITDRTDKTSTINFQPKVFYADESVAYLNYNTPFYVGIHTIKRKIQFPKNVTGFHLGVVNAPNDTVKGKSLGCIIVEYQDGMENWDIPYFTGMTSVKMPVLSSIGKNLFDKTKTTPNKYIASTGAELDEIGTNRNSTDYIRVYPNSEITLSGIKNSGTTNSSTQFYIAQYGENKQLIKCQVFTVTSDSVKLTTDSATKYIRTTVKDDDLDRCQIEQGTVATTYEAHKSNILSLSEEVVLRSLPSGVYDTYNIVTKEYVQRIKEVAVTFDATSVSDTLISNAYSYVISPVDKELNMETGFLCDKVPKLIYYGNDGTCGMYENKMNFVIWDKNVTSKQEFANKYSGLKLQYKLATPVIKTVVLSSVNQDKVDTGGVFKSFSNGHIQLSSGVENSLIPSLDYEVPTSNSYHLDLAKVSTKYTMKNMSGTFAIDGTQYNASTNGTFTTPSTMTNKLMVTSATQSNPMLLEGDVTSKTLSYFKGIKSAFEDKDKIEVLSTGKNLFTRELYPRANRIDVVVKENSIRVISKESGTYQYQYFKLNLKPNTTYTFSMDAPNSNLGFWNTTIREVQNGSAYGKTYIAFDNNNSNNYRKTFTTSSYIGTDNIEVSVVLYATGDVASIGDVVYNNIQVEETINKTTYESCKLNNVKIPLLKPLRSLLSGICDEIIVNQQENKAKIIQRVDIVDGKLVQLATPTTIEVDIEGFPYVYKNGHIFLNTDISPKTIVKYSINQSHVIESQNSDIIRHEKETDYLYKLIGEYVRVSYESTLLTLNLEL